MRVFKDTLIDSHTYSYPYSYVCECEYTNILGEWGLAVTIASRLNSTELN